MVIQKIFLTMASALCIVVHQLSAQGVMLPLCSSPIFCFGPILHTVQMARLTNDSKSFVDMRLKDTPQQTYLKFLAWFADNPTPQPADVQQFVDANFEPEGSEFEVYTPTDFKPNPAILSAITDPEYRDFARQLHEKWPSLGRQMSSDVTRNPLRYTIIPVPHPFIVPGGRFREFYYWDSYWIVLGLLHSEMHTTVRGMLEKFVTLVRRYGYMPSGSRIYMLGRSQVPLLIPMVREYLSHTGDLRFLVESINALELEFAYWMHPDKTVRVRGHTLSRYTTRSNGPRPEAYWEDRQYSAEFDTELEELDFFRELKAVGESGMDFTSRWFIRNGTNVGSLTDTRCSRIVPVELNAVLFANAQTLADFYQLLGNAVKGREYRALADRLRLAIAEVLWHEDVGAWLDWDLDNGRRRDYFVATNLSPLWMGAYNRTDAEHLSERVMGYIGRNRLDGFVGGVPNTLVESGEQWDMPNVWPPMQHMLVSGLEGLGTPDATRMAFKWASKWVFSNYVAFNETGNMYEKYSATEIGQSGSGGDYDVQLGFGWTNGVLLDLLRTYGRRLEARDINNKPNDGYIHWW